MTDTANALNDFDICLSLSEIAINTQLSEAWRIWRKAGSLDEIFEVKVYDDGDFDSGLTCKFAAPKLSLSETGDKLSQLGVTLKIMEGTAAYNGGAKQFDIARATIQFFVDLEKKPITVDEIRKIDQATATSVLEIMDSARKNDHLSYDDLSIEALFLNLTNPDMIGAQTKMLQSNGAEFSGKQSSVLIGCLREMFKAGNGRDCILGTLVHVKPAARRLPTLVPSQFVFKVSPYQADPRANSLDYLGVFQGRSLNRGAEARAAIRHPWIDPAKITDLGMTAGVMAIKGDEFSGLIIDALEHGFRATAREKTSAGWKLSASDKRISIENKGAFEYDSHQVSSWIWTLTVVPRPGESYYELSLTLQVTEYLGLSHSLSSNFRGEWSRKAQTSAKLFLDEDNSSLGFSVKPRLEPQAPVFQIEDMAYQEIESSWTRSVDRVFDRLFVGQSAEDVTEGRARETAKNLSHQLEGAFANLVIRLANFDFVPPGEQEFNFTVPRFTIHADLIMDVKYKKPVITSV